jgi:hypothetical protein
VLGSTSGAVLAPSEATCSPWMKFLSSRVSVPPFRFGPYEPRWVATPGRGSNIIKRA